MGAVHRHRVEKMRSRLHSVEATLMNFIDFQRRLTIAGAYRRLWMSLRQRPLFAANATPRRARRSLLAE
jgi:hypothetical protein